ncbi:MAG: Cupin 2 conserved barrel domain protein [Chloroflexi bacterium]|nr:Cupin 2 conserved barrel domain protein [Chloroflexota bacterium]MEA2616176.1 mannose-6-phosphate isomerase [Chloroflexota bacterium]
MTEQAAPGPVSASGSSRVDKPWGYELRWAITDRYLGKVIHVDAGRKLSLQYHVQKDEAILVLRGELDLVLEDGEGELVTHRMGEGMSARVRPGRRHRFVAVSDVDLVEVSSPEIDDVVRLSDDYGRAGTSEA